MKFNRRDRERLEACDMRLTRMEDSHLNLTSLVVAHNSRCEKVQWWALCGYVSVSLIVIGFLLTIALHLVPKG